MRDSPAWILIGLFSMALASCATDLADKGPGYPPPPAAIEIAIPETAPPPVPPPMRPVEIVEPSPAPSTSPPPPRQYTQKPGGTKSAGKPAARSPASTEAPPSTAIGPAIPVKARGAGAPEPAKVAWNTPPIMVVGQTKEIELRITFDPERFKDIEERIKASGETTSVEVELMRNLTAKLTSSPAFLIDPPEPRQDIARGGRDARWVWLVTPKTKGTEKLLLTITSNYGDGPTSEQLVRSIDVVARDGETSQQILDFVLKNWEKLMTVVFIPIGVLGWKSWRKGRPD